MGAARAEAGGSHDSFVSHSDRCEDHSTRFHRVTSVMHHNLGSTLHAFFTGVCTLAWHWSAWWGFFELGEFGGRHRRWGTSLLCIWVNEGIEYEYSRRSAVDELARTQQASRKLHEETWAGLLQKPGLQISQGVEIIPGCTVTVTCPSCPFNSPVSPGPGRVIGNSWGLVKVGGVWLFRGAL